MKRELEEIERLLQLSGDFEGMRKECGHLENLKMSMIWEKEMG